MSRLLRAVDTAAQIAWGALSVLTCWVLLLEVMVP